MLLKNERIYNSSVRPGCRAFAALTMHLHRGAACTHQHAYAEAVVDCTVSWDYIQITQD